MIVESLRVPPLEDNAYLVVDETTREAVVVDPAAGAQAILAKAQELGATIKVILNTHGHPDHTADNASLQASTGAKIGIFEVDAGRLQKNAKEAPWYLSAPPLASKADLLLKEGSEVRVGSIVLVTLHTPGHTEGSASFYSASGGVLFSGDTLFAGSCGRTDVQGGSPARMASSLRRLARLPPTTRVLPGHGPETVIEKESWIADLAYPIV